MQGTDGASRKPVLASLQFRGDPLWDELVEEIPLEPALGLVAWVRRFVGLARGREAIILRATVTFAERYRDFVGATVLKVLPGRTPKIVFSDATIEPTSRALASKLPAPLVRLLPLLAKSIVRAADSRHVTWCVLSTAELTSFPQTWGVDPARVRFTPFTHTLWDGADNPDVSSDGYVFAGGNSLRDYDVLLDAVLSTDIPVRIATTWTSDRTGPNVTLGPVPHEEFLTLLHRASVVVVPLVTTVRSTGQQTYLNAMALGKPTIVTDAPGVRDHIEDGVTGVVVPPRDPAALRNAIEHALDPAHAPFYAAMGVRARDAVLSHYTPAAYRRSLLALTGALPEGR